MKKVFAGQATHLLAFVGIGTALLYAVSLFPEASMRAFGRSALEWTAISWAFAGLMQAWIWFFWRTELHLGLISRAIGRFGWLLFRIGFVTLATLRFAPLVALSLATAHTSPVPRPVAIALLVITTPPIVWTFYSFTVYFGLNRAMGADHFDASYRTKTLETRGIFRYVRNPGYAVGLLLLYHAGLFWESALALVVAAAHHAFVWVAYFCSERPDMREIYGSSVD